MDSITLFFPFLLTLHLYISGVISTKFSIVNKCEYTVWPGILSNAGIPSLSTTGFVLQTGESTTLTAPTSWGGRFWGRTHCSQHSTTGIFSCLTADCASGEIQCSGNGATPPATLAEFTLDGAGGLDFFDVSLVDGYNVAMLVVPTGGSSAGKCSSTGCIGDLNSACPSELQVTSVDENEGVVACKSACEAFGSPQYCCSGAYSTPDTCKPSSYSQVFKTACPRAYSYAYDDRTSTFTCQNADYTITFCPGPNTSQKASQGENTNQDSSSASTQLNNGTMVYVGAADQSEISWATCAHMFQSHAIASIMSITMVIFTYPRSGGTFL